MAFGINLTGIKEVEQDTVYIPVPVPMSYFNEQEQEEGIIKPKKNK